MPCKFVCGGLNHVLSFVLKDNVITAVMLACQFNHISLCGGSCFDSAMQKITRPCLSFRTAEQALRFYRLLCLHEK